MAMPFSMRSGVDQMMQLRGRENMPPETQTKLKEYEDETASVKRDIQQAELREQRIGTRRKELTEAIPKKEKEIATEKALEREAIVKAPEHQTQVAEFNPTKTSGSDMMNLFAMLSAVAFMSGGKGRYDGLAAMGNLSGALEGWNKGRQDLFKQEALTFDKNLKALQDHNRMIEQKLKNALDMWAVNREAAMGEVAELRGELAGSEIQQTLTKGELDRAYTKVKELRTATDKTIDRWDEMVGKVWTAEQQAQRDARIDERQQRTFDQQLKMLELRLRNQGTGLKPSAEVSKTYVSDAVLKNDINELATMLEKSPSLRQKVTSDRLAGFLSEESKIFAQAFQTERDPEVRQFLQRIADMRNNYFLTISGKAVTVQEALRSYNAVPSPGDSPEAMIDKMRGMERRVAQKISLYKQMYPVLPDLDASLVNSSATGSPITKDEVGKTFSYVNPEAPVAQPAPQAAPTIQPGEVRQGFRFKGGNPADKNNWEKVSG